MENVHRTVNKRSKAPEPLQWRSVCRSMAPLAVRLWGEHVDGGNERIEDRMLAGWAMPDGTVWGRVPSSFAEIDISNVVGGEAISESAEERAMLVRWWQLDCLLALVAECLPDMARIGRAVDNRSRMPSGVETNGMEIDETEEDSVQNSTSADDDNGTAMEDENNEDEEEIVFFRGRPQTALDRKIIEEQRPVLPAQPPSRLLSPEQKQQLQIKKRQKEYLIHQQRRQQLKQQQGQNIVGSQAAATTAPIATAAASRAKTQSPLERSMGSTPYVPLVDAERDEVIRPVVGQQLSQQHSQHPRVLNAIGSQRMPATSAAAAASNASSISSTTEAFSDPRIAVADDHMAMVGMDGLFQAARTNTQYRSPTALELPAMPPMMPSASMHGVPSTGNSSSLTSPYAQSSAHQSLLGSPVAPSQQQQQQHPMAAGNLWSPPLRPSASQSAIGTTTSLLTPQQQQQQQQSVTGNSGSVATAAVTADRGVLEKWQEYAQMLQEQTQYNQQLRQQLRHHLELRDRHFSSQAEDGDATAVSVASMA
ncbi:hypothetical protein FBU59_004861, partial [Linderina macrospora]